MKPEHTSLISHILAGVSGAAVYAVFRAFADWIVGIAESRRLSRIEDQVARLSVAVAKRSAATTATARAPYSSQPPGGTWTI